MQCAGGVVKESLQRQAILSDDRPDFILNLPPYTYSDIKLPCLEMSAQLAGSSSAFISCARPTLQHAGAM